MVNFADEEDFVAVFLAGIADQLVFFERQRQRLLAENMFARLERFEHIGIKPRLDVPAGQGTLL